MMPMYKLLIKEIKDAHAIGMAGFLDMLGSFFVVNHAWKVSIPSVPLYSAGKLLPGRELSRVLGADMSKASFSVMEGEQVLFKIVFGEGWAVYTMKRQWVEFLEEKCVVLKEEISDDGFDDFMLD